MYDLRIIAVLLLCLTLSSCGGGRYFSCPDAKGASCYMLRDIDNFVTSGEIERFYGKKAAGDKCGCAK